MPLFDCVQGVRVSEIVCVLPGRSWPIAEYAPNLLNEKTAKRMARETGFHTLRIAPDDVTTADLFAAGAERILAGHDRGEIAALVFVTKTADYDTPATSHILQDKLGLGEGVLCLDINEGCSGFIKGFYEAAVLSSRLKAPVLLGCGDTNSKITNPNDRASRCIYGDGAAAILIEPGENDIPFAFSSFGSKHDAVIMENSGYRLTEHPKNNGGIFLDGIEILNFSLNEVPDVVNAFMERNNLTHEEISLYAAHQANKLIVDSLADRLGVPQEKMPFLLGDVGNDSSASIPSLLVRISDKDSLKRVLCCGFGVGMSVGVCLADFSDTKTSEVYLS